MNNTQLFRGGMPYSPDVNRLKEAFPVPKLTEGTIITHEQLQAIVQREKGSSRYYGVIDSWIAQQRNDNNIYMVWEPSLGLKVLNPAEVLHVAEIKTRQKLKQTGRAIRIFGWVDRARLDSVGQQRLDHQLRVASAIRTSIDSSRKELAIDLAPVKSLPKPRLVREA